MCQKLTELQEMFFFTLGLGRKSDSGLESTSATIPRNPQFFASTL